MDPKDLDYLRDVVKRSSGIVLEADKAYLLESRLGTLARAEGLEDVPSLVKLLRMHPHGVLKEKVVDAMTTNETSFFRDLHPFDALRLHIVPELLKVRAATRSLNIWSAVCSSGQEPYSLMMMLYDAFPELKTWNLRLLATDLSPSMVERAKDGKYSKFEISRGLPATMLTRYFKKEGDFWQVVPDVRRVIDFRVMNLVEPWPAIPTMDVVLIRNVLIYFDEKTKEAVLRNVRRRVRDDGYVFLGGSETMLGLSVDLHRSRVANSWCYRPTAPVPT